ncbi:winged helix-turn-helix domain-containing protein [Lipingzhangella sp. LS1_29]|uniref:Winged helix-turn-helix domain-containing protein n=1 Tax=Lipingzhangella rawalii TaxID=2055835 RepID=A0ABU2H6P2_9ACTN|nr:winged helix-turn-helix domain-containing protein [Lipingzhangella rawalii]MDS1270948.1 winged helix-turn-helix domain-containing protein [Lipingzhangella rawalii]
MSNEDKVPEFDPKGPELLYAALADHIAARIAVGELQPNMRLAPERELAEEYGVAYLTVRRAMKELRERGLIVTVHGKGTFIAEQPPGDGGP